jgi:hypothetical protein
MANNFGRVNVSITASTGGLTAGLSKAGRQLKGFQKSVGGLSALSGTLGGMMPMLMPVVGGFATLAGAVAALTSATRSAEALHNLSQELGVAAGELQVMQQVAAESGVSQQLLTTGLRRTARMVGELAQGTPAAAKAFAQLGLTMDDLAGLSTTEQLALIADRIAALPPHMQAAASIDIFGRSGQGMLNFLRQGGQAFREMDRLLTDLGVKMSGPQVAAIESMGDAIGRLSLPMQGFVNQFLAELAPAITAASNLIVDFFAKNTAGWTMAKTLADGLVSGIRMVVGAMTLLTGIFQVFMALGSKIGQMFSEVFSIILDGVANVMDGMAGLAEAAGFAGLADSLSQGAQGAAQLANGASQMGEMYGQSAADTFGQAVQNIGSPFAAFDREFAAAQADAQKAGAAGAGAAAGESIGAAIKAASSELSALVVGSSGGESYRNMLARGGDPRLSGADAAKQTADNTERAADGIEDVAAAVREIPGFGQAQLAMV